jgi:hypothetical protein
VGGFYGSSLLDLIYCAREGGRAARTSNNIMFPHIVLEKNVLDDIEHKLDVLCICGARDMPVHVAVGGIAIESEKAALDVLLR